MPVRLVTADDWRPSSITERRLLQLEREGLLRRRTSLSSPEWIAPAADHREPRPPKGYVVSFAKFHHHGLGAPPSRFMWALCHHYGLVLQHFSPNAITVAAVFAAVCEGYLGIPLGAVAPPLQGRALQRPRWSRRSEEARAGRVPKPGAEDREDGEAARVHPGGVVIEPRWVGLLVVLPEE